MDRLVLFIKFIIVSGIFSIIGLAIGKSIMRFTHGMDNIPNIAYTVPLINGLKAGITVGIIWIFFCEPVFFRIMIDKSPETNMKISISVVALYIAAILFIGAMPLFI